MARAKKKSSIPRPPLSLNTPSASTGDPGPSSPSQPMTQHSKPEDVDTSTAEKFASAQHDNQKLSEDNESLRAELTTLRERLNNAENEERSLRSQLNHQHFLRGQAETQSQYLEQRLADVEANFASSKSEILEWQVALKSAKKERDSEAVTREAADEEVGKLDKELKDLKKKKTAEYTKLEKELVELKKWKDGLERSEEAFRTQRDSLLAETKDLKRQLVHQNNELNQKEGEATSLEEQVLEGREKIAKLEKRREEAIGQVEELADQLREMEKKMGQLEIEKVELENRLGSLSVVSFGTRRGSDRSTSEANSTVQPAEETPSEIAVSTPSPWATLPVILLLVSALILSTLGVADLMDTRTSTAVAETGSPMAAVRIAASFGDATNLYGFDRQAAGSSGSMAQTLLLWLLGSWTGVQGMYL